MKMVKSLLLGSAAGLVAIAGAQAADLPVKAKAVEYVKVCSLYGAGYYYIPGTDTCLKVGGYVRQEIGFGPQASMSNGEFNNALGTRNEHNFIMRTRAYATFDARTQTAYGTLRSYLSLGALYDSPNGSTFNSNRAMIQFAGFTFGTATSFFDFYNVAASSYWGNFPFADTGDGGWKVAAYTAQLGGGISASIAIEEPRRMSVINSGTSFTANQALAVLFGPTSNTALPNDEAGVRAPDVVANIRADGAWGSAQLSGAIHDVAGSYYTAAAAGNVNGAAMNPAFGRPGDAIGWAVSGGLKLNADMVTKGDWFQISAIYTQGALGYAFSQMKASTGGSLGFLRADGTRMAYGLLTDGVYANQGNIDLTTAWVINASYEHFWTPALHTSLYGYYAAVNYNTAANANLCTLENSRFFTADATGVACNNNWSTWGVGARTQWDVTKQFYVGLDIGYNKLTTATPNTAGATSTLAANGALPAGYITQAVDLDQWQFRFRAHRDFFF